MGKKSLHLYHHFGKKTIFMQATNTFTIKTNIIPTVATDDVPSCEVPSRRRTIKPPAWQKDY